MEILASENGGGESPQRLADFLSQQRFLSRRERAHSFHIRDGDYAALRQRSPPRKD